MTTGSIISPAGTFSTAAAPGQRLNPFTNARPWGTITIGGLLIPGVVQSIDGAIRPDIWAVQMGISVSGAVTVWRGTQLAETIKIVTALHNQAAFDAWYDVRDKLRPKIGKKPPALTIENPAINFSGITRVACRHVGPPMWQKQGGYWTGEIALIEFRPPKPIPAGTVEPPKPTAEDPANVKATQKAQDLLDEAARLQ